MQFGDFVRSILTAAAAHRRIRLFLSMDFSTALFTLHSRALSSGGAKHSCAIVHRRVFIGCVILLVKFVSDSATIYTSDFLDILPLGMRIRCCVRVLNRLEAVVWRLVGGVVLHLPETRPPSALASPFQ